MQKKYIGTFPVVIPDKPTPQMVGDFLALDEYATNHGLYLTAKKPSGNVFTSAQYSLQLFASLSELDQRMAIIHKNEKMASLCGASCDLCKILEK